MIAFSNVRVFDGESASLASANVVVAGDRIVSVDGGPPPPNAEIIDSGGRTLMPGLIDAHIHAYAAQSGGAHDQRGRPVNWTPGQ